LQTTAYFGVKKDGVRVFGSQSPDGEGNFSGAPAARFAARFDPRWPGLAR